MSKSTPQEDVKFPSDFLWGTAIAGHQNEGNNKNSDWWHWEQAHKNFPKSNDACDHYNRFEEDFKLAKDVLNNNAIRLSIEWSRIESEEGKWDEKEIAHYREVFNSLKKNKMQSLVTILHFVTPQWFAEKGGFEKKENCFYFERYALFITNEFKDEVDYWVTMNEPHTIVGGSYLMGMWPQGMKNLFLAYKVLKNLSLAHKNTYFAVKKNIPDIKLGVVVAFSDLHFHKRFPFATSIKKLYGWFVNRAFLSYCGDSFDFLGLNYYTKHDIHLIRDMFYHITVKKIKEGLLGKSHELEFIYYPEGIYNVLNEAQKYGKPIIITENGISEPADKLRPQFIIDHLSWVAEAIKDGIDVRGYFHWTLMDNFEWAFGFEPKFGLFETDFKTQKRTPRKSALVYGEICKNNRLP